MAALVWLIAGPASYAQSLDPHKPAPLGPGVNKGNVDGGTGSHYYYFLAGPGHVNVKMAFLEMGLFGSPQKEVLSFDFYNESGELMSHNAVVSFDRLERIEIGGDFGSRQKIVLAIVPQKGLVKLGGYYEVEVTGAATFDRGGAVGSDGTPIDARLVHPGGTPVASATPTPAASPTATKTTLPTFFPPKATATAEVPLHLIKDGISLGELAERVGTVMDSVGYIEKSFYSLDAVDNKGCAIVTHIEQIEADGRPVTKGRWSFPLPSYENFSIRTFLSALFTAKPGYYRLIALVVSEKPLVEKPNPLSPSQAQELIHGPKFPPPIYGRFVLQVLTAASLIFTNSNDPPVTMTRCSWKIRRT